MANARNRYIYIDPEDDKRNEAALEKLKQSVRTSQKKQTAAGGGQEKSSARSSGSISGVRKTKNTAWERSGKSRDAFDSAVRGNEPSFLERVGKVLTGSAKSTGADYASGLTTLYEAGQQGRSARNQEALKEYLQNLETAKRDLETMLEMNRKKPGTFSASNIKGQQNLVDDAQRKVDAFTKVKEEKVQQKATQASHEAAGTLSRSGAEDIEAAKEGLGAVGRTLVDAVAAGTQMAGDIAAGALTGGGTKLAMAARSFGGGSREAREEGASIGQQLAYGGASAALSVATEQLSNLAKPFSKAFGKGFADDMVSEIIGKAVEKLGRTPVARTTLNALGRTAASAAGEGLEEMVEDLFQPVIKLIYQSDSQKSALENLRRTYGENFDASEMLYDGLVGGILGAVGGGVDTAMGARGQYREYQRQSAGEAVDNAYDTMAREGMFSTQAREAAKRARDLTERVAEYDITPRLDAGLYGHENTASQGAEIKRLTMEDFVNENSPVWNNIPYDDITAQAERMRSVHQEMVDSGKVVHIPESTKRQVSEFYPDLRSMKKSERTPILRQKMNELKTSLRQFLDGLKGSSYEFEVNGNILEAKLYDTGVREVMEKITQDKAAMLYHSDQVFQNAQYLYSMPDYDGNPNIYRWNYFYTPVQIGDDIVGVRIAVRDMVPSNRGTMDSQIYNWGIKKDVTLDGGRPGGNPNTAGVSSVTPERDALRTDASKADLSKNSIPDSAPGVNPGRDPYDITPRLDAGINDPAQQGINMDLTTSEAKLTGRDPALSLNLSGPVEGTRSLNFDSTVPQGTNAVILSGAAENPGSPRGSGALDALGIHVAGDQGNYENAAQLRGTEEGRRKTQQARQQAERRLQPSNAEKRFAKGIADGDFTAADIPASMQRGVVLELADYYYAENTYKHTEGVKEQARDIREENELTARELLGDTLPQKKPRMLLMNERTPERVMRSLFGEELGEAINRTYIYPVQQNEAEKLRFINRMFDQVRTFQDSSGRESQLTKQERSLVQQMLEDRFVGETVASMETAESIRSAAENIKNGKDAGDSAREFSLDAREKELAQQLARWMQNEELLRSGKVDGTKISNAVERYAAQYDLFYDAINDFLTAHGYQPIGFIKGYAPHMQGVDTQNKLQSALRSLGVNTDAMELPTSISGLTADYKPGKRWNPFFQTRHGSSTDYDAASGYESYVSYLADVLYHTDDIARLRGLSRYLRKTYGPEEISNAIDHAEGLRSMDTASQLASLRDAGRLQQGSTLTPEDTRAELESYIDSLYDEVKNMTQYGEFVKYIDNYANILAGKQSMADRGMEYMAGRNSLSVGNRLVSAFARAQVAGNVSSALNQSAQLAQLLAEVDGRSVLKGAADLVKATGGKLWNIKAAELFDQSDLLTTKKGIDYLTADDSKLDRLVTDLFKPAEMMDGLISALTVQSKYEQLRSSGLGHAAAMDEANRFATSIMASRAKGSRPLAYESKNLISQMLHMFQVEAVNSWDHIAQDLPRQYKQVAKEHGKQAAGRALATVAVKGLVSAFLLNRITEAAYGGTPAPFDVLGWISNFVASGSGMSTNAWLQSLVDAGWEKLFGEALFGGGDDEEDQEEEKQPFDWGQASDDLVYNLLNDIPFVRNAAGLLGLGDQTMPLTNIAEAVQGVGQAAKASGVLSGETGGALLTLGASMLPGGRQLQKTFQGGKTILDQGRTYGYGDNQRLQYPVERDPLNIVQAVLFGNSGLAESRDFYASGNSGLSAKQTQLVNEMGKSGTDRTAVYDAIQAIRREEDRPAKADALAGADLSDEEKLQVFEQLVSGSESRQSEDLRRLMDMGVSWDQMIRTYPFASNSAASRYVDYVKNGLAPETAGGLAKAMEELEPEAGRETVSDLQRYRTVVDYGLSRKDQLTVLKGMMDDSEYETMLGVCQKGLTPEQFVTFREGTSGLSADKDRAGKTISGSKKRKVMAYIDSMDLSNAQKTSLYYAAGYAASTLDEAPWYGRSESRWNIVPQLGG